MATNLIKRNSGRTIEKTHRYLERISVIALSLVTVFDFVVWKYRNAYWNIHEWLELASVISLAILTIAEIIVLKCGERMAKRQRIEAAEKEANHEAKLDELRARAAESSMTDHVTAKMANDLLPRSLSDSQKQVMQQLSKFKRQRFRVYTTRTNSEGIAFGESIIDFLKSECGWIPILHCNFIDAKFTDGVSTDFPDEMGIGISVVSSAMDFVAYSEGNPSTIPLRDEVMKIMEGVGITTFMLGAKSISSLEPGAIGFLIGAKPINY